MKVSMGRYTIEVGNADKVLFPDDGITKGELVAYYERVAGTMLPHVEGRPVAMERFPDGISGDGFFQKDAPDHFPDWIERARVRKEGGSVDHVVIRRGADLVYLAEQACIIPHVWPARADDLDHPDRLIFDLDPSGEDVGVVRAAARAVRAVLDEIGLVPFVMTTGSRGFHVWAPIGENEGWDQVRDLAKGVARVVAARDSSRFTIEQRKSKRGHRVLVDYLRNAYAQTAVPPYAVRARPGAPVATPLDWDEVGDVEPRGFTMENLFRRLDQREDPWSSLSRHARSPEGPRTRLAELLDEAA